jgi:glutamate---cysteine ligase / carboxylate-amine ligase
MPAMQTHGHIEPAFTLGIEEEYLLVDQATRDLVADPPAELLQRCICETDGRVSPEFLRSQLEVKTSVCGSVSSMRRELAALRLKVCEIAAEYGIAPIAASTHPFAKPKKPLHSEGERYAAIAREVQAGARRMVICGMHVHVGLEDDELRIDAMNQLSYIVPHLHAMSCSSPFWEGDDMGMQSFRLMLLSSLPRTGLPESFESYGEFRRHLDALVRNGLIEDTTKIWWDIRPSSRYQTLETRVFDCCTHLDDAVCLAALNLSLVRMLYRLRRENKTWRRYPRMLIAENRWRAMRFGSDASLLDLARGELVPFADLLEELLAITREDAIALDCLAETEHARVLLKRGTSAHQQHDVYQTARAQGATDSEALSAVVGWLVKTTSAPPALLKFPTPAAQRA